MAEALHDVADARHAEARPDVPAEFEARPLRMAPSTATSCYYQHQALLPPARTIDFFHYYHYFLLLPRVP